MNYPPPPSYHRTNVTILLSSQNIPTEIPIECQQQSLISDKEFDSRIQSIKILLRKYSWSSIERIFLISILLLSFLAPPIVSTVLAHVFVSNAEVNNVGATDETLFEAIQQGRFQANAIGGGILFGMIILFWIPYMGHKMMGRKKIMNLITSWNSIDSTRGTQKLLVWSLVTMSAFTRTATISVVLPPPQPPTLFHPQAYLPSYLEKEAERIQRMVASLPVAGEVEHWEDEKL